MNFEIIVETMCKPFYQTNKTGLYTINQLTTKNYLIKLKPSFRL